MRVKTISVNLILSTALWMAVPAQSQQLAIVGATLIDVHNYGRSTQDTLDSIVLIDKGKITAAGSASEVTVPPGTKRIDARGKYLIPGLIDGFGALRTQAFASAYLYDGVTTVYVGTLAPQGGGDGERKILRDAVPGPRLFLGAQVTGYSEDGVDPSDKPLTDHRLHDRRLSNEQLIARVDRLAEQGFRGVTVAYDVWPDQVDVIVAEAKRRGLAVLAELGFTDYPYAIRSGVDALLRNDYYQMELAPAVAKLARSDNQAAGNTAYRAICAMDPASPRVSEYGDQIAKSRTSLMPTLVLPATADSLDVPNPWSAPSAALIKAEDLDNPVNRATGESGYLAPLSTEKRDFVRQCARHGEAVDGRFYQLGAKFLAASIAPSYGIMPGSGLHVEMSLLHRIGLSPREAIAAATSNYADVYGWQDVGRIEAGREADILILDQDPRLHTSALDHINTLILGGIVIDRQHLLAPATRS